MSKHEHEILATWMKIHCAVCAETVEYDEVGYAWLLERLAAKGRAFVCCRKCTPSLVDFGKIDLMPSNDRTILGERDFYKSECEKLLAKLEAKEGEKKGEHKA